MDYRLYAQRRERRLTQKDMASILRISKAAYQNKETGKSAFTLPEAILLANYFGLTLDELFGSGASREKVTT